MDIAEYCCYDVKITRMIANADMANRKVHYRDKYGKKLTVPVAWA